MTLETHNSIYLKHQIAVLLMMPYSDSYYDWRSLWSIVSIPGIVIKGNSLSVCPHGIASKSLILTLRSM